MNYEKRNKEIRILHKGTKEKKGLTYRRLAKDYGITDSRIGQICNPKYTSMFYCDRHNKKYDKECPFCKLDLEYPIFLENNGNLKHEIKILRKRDRSGITSRKRKIVITKLHDEFEFSFRRIGQLLERDHTTILHLYHHYKVEIKNYKN